MSTQVATTNVSVPAELQEKVLLGGDLARLTPAERLSYYNAVCASVGLNPLTRPFEYLALNGKLTLYARKDCTDQLRDLPDNQISVELVDRQVIDGVYVVTARAKNLVGRTDESVGAVPVPSSPTDKANAMMKAETKAKRRVTLSICGLGMLDETEVDAIAGAHPVSYRPTDLELEAAKGKKTETAAADGLDAHPSAMDGAIAPASQDALPPSTAQDYISKAKLSQSVRECSTVGNEAEADKHLTHDDLQTIRRLVKQRMGELGKK